MLVLFTALLWVSVSAQSNRVDNVESRAYQNLITNAEDGVYAVEDDQPTDAHTYWKGFPQYTARGLVLEHLRPTK